LYQINKVINYIQSIDKKYKFYNNVMYNVIAKNGNYYWLTASNISVDQCKNTNKIYYSNNDYYEGEIDVHNYKKHGYGKFYYNSGNVYEGMFYDDYFCGYGINNIIENNKRIICSGLYNNGLKHGWCEILKLDSSIINADLDIRTGYYEYNELIDELIIDKQCDICCKLVHPRLMFNCGCNMCVEKYCENCVFNIYRDLVKGSRLTSANKDCKFCCRRIVNKDIIKIFNENLQIYNLEKDTIYGYCNSCETIEQIKNPENVCDTEKNKNDFCCSTCSEKKSKIKQCPGCHIYILKNGGCLHMTCNCKSEWCWKCKKKWSNYECGCISDSDSGGSNNSDSDNDTDSDSDSNNSDSNNDDDDIVYQ
jgi:hypothetical protein